MLVATLLDKVEVFQVIAASLRGAVSLVPLDQPPDPEAAQVIELHAPGLDRPILLLGRSEGEPVAGMFPLRLKPLNLTQAAELRTFLRAQAAPRTASGEDLEAVEDPDVPGRYAMVSRRPAPVESAPGREEEDPAAVDAASLAFEDTIATAAPRVWEEPSDTITSVDAPPPPPEPLEADKTIVDPTPPIGEPTLTRTAAAPPPTMEPPPGAGPEGESEGEIEGLVVGRLLGGGKYVVESLIGSGGAGRVYRARHSALEAPVAIKVLHARHQKDDRFVARFRREARATSMLDHPNVMRVLDFGQEDDGLLYIVMEYLDGQDLQRIIDLEAPLPLSRIVGILSQVCAALTSAHEVGIIHRDMKPENVIVMRRRDDDGTLTDVVKVCDFGLAKIQELEKRRKSSANLTLIGTIWGTPEYMSPEQIRDELLDPRSDIYSCGVILYEMAAGRLPFVGDSAVEILTKHIMTPPDPPSHHHPGVSGRLEDVILRALNKDRERRQQNARELRAELRGLLEGTPAAPFASQQAPKLSPVDPTAQHAAGTPSPAAGEESLAQTVPHVKASQMASELADRLVKDPNSAGRSFRQMLDADKTSGAHGPLELTLVMLATQGEMRALWQLVAGLERIARDREGMMEPRHRALATRALQSLGEVGVLDKVAHALLDGPVEVRAPAREILTTLGVAGARALCKMRLEAELSAAGRGRFVAVLREMGSGAMSALGSALTDLDPSRAEADPGLVEDLLRAVPEESSESFAQVAMTHVASRSAAVRRAAAGALILVRGSRARETLSNMFDDPDEAVRIACLAGLRRIRAVDGVMVRRIEALVANTSAAEEGLLATAIAALGGVTADARPEAIALLSRIVEPAGLMARLVGGARPRHSDFVIETAARALLVIGGPEVRQLIARSANREKGTLRDRLRALIE